MKLTKKLEAEILKAYNTIWDAYLKGDMRVFASMLDENCYIIGSAAGEVFSNKKAAVKYYKSTAEQITGKAELRNRKINVMDADNGFIVNEESDFYLVIDDQWTFYGPARISSLLHKKKNKWKVIHQHGSFPDSKTEGGELVNVEKIKAENIQLRDAVKRRTIQLEEKNRELEIEAAVERVRAKALAMRQSEEILTVVVTLWNELKALNIPGVIASAIYLEQDDGQIRLWDLTSVTELENGFYQAIDISFGLDEVDPDLWIRKIWSSTEKYFVVEESDFKKVFKWVRKFIGGKAVEDARRFIETNNIKKLWIPAVQLEKGRLICDFIQTPPVEMEAILIKMGAAFDLAYKRFLDLQNAEARAKEAQIEAALEKVRSRSLAMHKSVELNEVILVVIQKLQELDISMGNRSAAIFTFEEENKDYYQWAASPEISSTFSLLTPYIDHPVQNDIWNARRKQIDFLSKSYSKKEKNSFFKYLFENTELKHMPRKDKDWALSQKSYDVAIAFEKNSAVAIVSHSGELLSEDQNAVLKRFARVFEQSYTRFLDLQKAEAQAKEAQIEAALEKVRSRSLAMHKSDELIDVIKKIYTEFQQLGFDAFAADLMIFTEDKKSYDIWVSREDGTEGPYRTSGEILHHPHHIETMNAWMKGDVIRISELKGELLNSYIKIVVDVSNFSEEGEKKILSFNNLIHTEVFTKHGCIRVASSEKRTEEQLEIQKRFAKVFDQAYTRFLDLQKAEAQAREAQIETALERVRSRTMGMQKSEELKEVIQVVFEQFGHLNIQVEHTGFIMDYKTRDDMHIWLADKHAVPFQVTIPYFDCAHWNSFIEAKEKGLDFFANHLTFEEKNKFYQDLFKLIPGVPEETLEYYFSCPGLAISTVLLENVGLYIENFSGIPYSDEENATLMRFGNVFQQTYTRFLDLQKAEAQAREAQIEAALEKVRGRAMAIRKSDELTEVIQIIFEELNKLGIDLMECSIATYDSINPKDLIFWSAGPFGSAQSSSTKLQYIDHPIMMEWLNDFKGGTQYRSGEYSGELLRSWWDRIFVETDFKYAPADFIESWKKVKQVFYSQAAMSHGFLEFLGSAPLPDDKVQILKRFTNVIDLTYTRYDDVVKAEAQAREAEIELALERVRSRAMAMHSSQELKDVATELRNQMNALGQTDMEICAIHLYDESPDYFESIAAGPVFDPMLKAIQVQVQVKLPKQGIQIIEEMMNQYHSEKKDYVLVNQGKKGVEWFELLKEKVPLAYEFVIQHLKETSLEDLIYYWSISDFKGGSLVMTTYVPPADEVRKILRRFANVFGLAYQRFKDLKKAEEQAKEAQIELALERVRARTMAMQHSEELQDTSLILFQQLKELGEPAEQCTIGIIMESEGVVEISATLHGNKMQQTFRHRIDEPFVMNKIFRGWKDQQRTLLLELEEEELKKYNQYRNELVGTETFPVKLLPGDRRIIHAAYFSKGMLALSTNEPRPAESLELLQRFAIVFEQTYIRFLDLQKAEAQAREALIEASLERVRTKAMTMHDSKDISKTAGMVLSELKKLDINPQRFAVGLLEKGSRKADSYSFISSPQGDSLALVGSVNLWGHPVLEKAYDCLQTGEDYFPELVGNQYKSYYESIATGFSLPPITPSQLKQKQFGHFISISVGYLVAWSDKPYQESEIKIIRRFASIIDLTFRRYLDLQKAEAQAREAQIEAALEKVRSRSLAMHKSDELKEVILVVLQKLQELGISMDKRGTAIVTFEPAHRVLTQWVVSTFQPVATGIYTPYYENPILSDYWEAKESEVEFYEKSYSKKDKDLLFSYFFNDLCFDMPKESRDLIFKIPYYSLAAAIEKNSSIILASHTQENLATGEIVLLKRFAKVFEQAYIRFLDLQKAEAQAREAKIEAALERTRTQSMLMQHSNELDITSRVFHEQLLLLGIESEFSYVWLPDVEKEKHLFWCTWANMENDSPVLKSKSIIYDLDRTEPYTAECFIAWESGESVHVYPIESAAVKQYFDTWSGIFSDAEKMRPEFFPDGLYYVESFMKYGCFGIIIHRLPTEDEKKILLRFTIEFERTYTRFLDLQKAEAQARDAQIEASLERVRSKTMAMHNSQDVGDTVASMFDELVKLGVETVRCGIGIMHEHNQMELWTARKSENEKVELIIGRLDMTIHPLLQGMYNGWKNKDTTFSYELKGNDLVDYFTMLINSPDYHISYDIASLPQQQFQKGFFFPEGALFAFSAVQLSAEASQIFKRFAGVFGQTYRRYLDLQKAEAQAREAKIEASLERVRARAMAMHKSEDLNPAVDTVFEELEKLNLGMSRCGIGIIDKEKRSADAWITSKSEKGTIVQISGDEPMDIHPLLQGAFDAWLKQEDFSYVLEGEDMVQYYKATGIGNVRLPESQLILSKDELKHQHYHLAAFQAGGLFAFRETPFSEEAKTVMKRFAGVFNLTYKRFLDLQKAEANAKEAKIEAALERVRSRTMAMHKSDELSETAVVLFKQLSELGNDPDRFSIGIIDEDANVMNVYATDQEGSQVNIRFKARFDERTTIDRMYKGWKAKLKSDIIHLKGKDLEDWIKYLRDELGMAINIEHFKGQRFHNVAYFSQGWLNFTTVEPTSPETISLLERFAAVFNLTYRRFLDLQKAEANAREAQIEAGLERVRARTMAMHSSDDVSVATATMFTELEKLGIENFRGGILNIRKNKTQEVWSVNTAPDGKVIRAIGEFDMNLHPFWQQLYIAWENKEELFHFDMSGKVKEDYVRILDARRDYLPNGLSSLPDCHVQGYYFGEGYVWTFSLQPHSEEDKQVMKKFASVFSLTFRRYQDLKKAEAQAREATIEAALEKVRGKAMAMHNSNDLTATASLVFTELRKLGISPIRCGVGILNKENRKALLYSAIATEEGDNLSQFGWVLLDVNPVLKSVYDHWIVNEDYFPVLTKEMLKAYYAHLKLGFEVPEGHQEYEQHGYFLAFSEGMFYGWGENAFTGSDIKVLKRFASVIDLTFRRYMELQKSEANAREAVKQAALDRVRAEIASMRTINDLDRITPLIWNELNVLGVSFIRCGVFIMDEDQQVIHTFLSTPDGKAIAAFHLPYDTPGNFSDMLSHWYNKKTYVSHWGEIDFIGIAETLVKQGAINNKEQYLGSLPKGGFYLHFLPFLQGMLYVGNTDQLNNEQIELIQHVADAFSTAYARYEDFTRLEAAKQQVENTLTDLKQAQTQLVQSEKMASLGELTAGIAHEIQNPLNFVNNFSDVSNELLEEMKGELATGNMQQAIEIAEDVKQNLEKILHHGKRADAIVKGMLQHSRTSSGQKEPTDINILADEYLRLAFHGLRAKDKSFNAKFETDFDNSIGKVNIIPQDIGRVILNLINNAFYAVTEKKKLQGNGYEPIVTVSTKAIKPPTAGGGLGVLVTVKDNGNGIPQKVLEKIFQPFFTTKPTGQGTGLGLSLAYDIVTKGHGGELKVETKEGEGSEFIIQLPNQSSQ